MVYMFIMDLLGLQLLSGKNIDSVLKADNEINYQPFFVLVFMNANRNTLSLN